MRYADIIYNDVVNAKGISITFYLQGCSHRCYNCFNEETWDFNGGKILTDKIIKESLLSIKPYENFYDNLVLLGGDPLQNLIATYKIIRYFKIYFPRKKIWCYTGYTWEELIESKNPLMKRCLRNIDILIDGKFQDDLKDLNLKYRGSSNQRIINSKKSLIDGKIIEGIV